MAVVLIGIGAFQLLKGSYDGEVSKREGATVGTLLYVSHRKSSTYQYRYQVNGVAIRDDSGTCKTPLTPAGCTVGATVLVYYDRDPATDTLLQEFAVAGREKIFFGSFMMGCGLRLLGLYPIAKKLLASPDESKDIDIDRPDNGREVIHVVPKDDLPTGS